MDRYYQCFKTKEERTAWEKEQKQNDERFHVCFRETVHVKNTYKYATVYTYQYNK